MYGRTNTKEEMDKKCLGGNDDQQKERKRERTKTKANIHII